MSLILIQPGRPLLKLLKILDLTSQTKKGGLFNLNGLTIQPKKIWQTLLGEQMPTSKLSTDFESLFLKEFNGQSTVKVSVQKEQMIQRDVLRWRGIATDSIEENTLLYRIGRIISIRTKLAKLEQERIKKELEKISF